MIARKHKPTFVCLFLLLCFVLLAAGALGQTEAPGSVNQAPGDVVSGAAGNARWVTIAPVPLITAPRTQQTTVELNFRVARGFHINSNAPRSEFLIPTALKMDVPTDIALGKIAYPAGQDVSFPFSPDEALNVYTGDFAVTLIVHPLQSVVPGKYVMHGVLRYQACDNAQCFPPKNLPVNFQVKVVKEPPGPRHNPAQSPHVHT